MVMPVLFATDCVAQDTVAAPFKPHDEFYWLEQMNKASDVMVVEQGIVTRPLGTVIADSVQKSIDAGDATGGLRPNTSQYLTLEQELIKFGGPDVTRVHSGRSRQDLIATVNRLVLRERDLEWMRRLLEVRSRLLQLAGSNVDTIIPAYTNGVQAQPITLAHYLLAYSAAFERDAERSRQAYLRLNLSPLGAAALGTSSFPINRPRLAALLGFDGVEQNSFDANLVSSLDVTRESIQIAAGNALTISSLIEDIELQYHETEPWLLLREGKLTGPSSIMPQKRNPYGLIFVRRDASDVLGEATTFDIEAHNLATGMLDYKHGQAEKVMDDSLEMLEQLSQVIDALVVDPKRSLAEVNDDYSTTTELADELQRDSNVPFRIGHHFASELVSYGRAHHLRPSELPFGEAQRIYRESAASFGISDATLPLTEAQFRNSLTAENMVHSAQVEGGPQKSEVERMLADRRRAIDADSRWLEQRHQALLNAQSTLNQTFNELRSAP
jgi:argininosuccinate lyase